MWRSCWPFIFMHVNSGLITERIPCHMRTLCQTLFSLSPLHELNLVFWPISMSRRKSRWYESPVGPFSMSIVPVKKRRTGEKDEKLRYELGAAFSLLVEVAIRLIDSFPNASCTTTYDRHSFITSWEDYLISMCSTWKSRQDDGQIVEEFQPDDEDNLGI